MVASLLKMAGLDWPVPAFSTRRRRQKALRVEIPCQPGSEPVHLLIDGTGIKAAATEKWSRQSARRVISGSRKVGNFTSTQPGNLQVTSTRVGECGDFGVR